MIPPCARNGSSPSLTQDGDPRVGPRLAREAVDSRAHALAKVTDRSGERLLGSGVERLPRAREHLTQAARDSRVAPVVGEEPGLAKARGERRQPGGRLEADRVERPGGGLDVLGLERRAQPIEDRGIALEERGVEQHLEEDVRQEKAPRAPARGLHGARHGIEPTAALAKLPERVKRGVRRLVGSHAARELDGAEGLEATRRLTLEPRRPPVERAHEVGQDGPEHDGRPRLGQDPRVRQIVHEAAASTSVHELRGLLDGPPRSGLNERH